MALYHASNPLYVIVPFIIIIILMGIIKMIITSLYPEEPLNDDKDILNEEET